MGLYVYISNLKNGFLLMKFLAVQGLEFIIDYGIKNLIGKNESRPT